MVVAETLNDGIDAHDVTRHVRQGAQPIGDLYQFTVKITKYIDSNWTRIPAYAIDSVSRDELIQNEDNYRERQIANEESNQN